MYPSGANVSTRSDGIAIIAVKPPAGLSGLIVVSPIYRFVSRYEPVIIIYSWPLHLERTRCLSRSVTTTWTEPKRGRICFSRDTALTCKTCVNGRIKVYDKRVRDRPIGHLFPAHTHLLRKSSRRRGRRRRRRRQRASSRSDGYERTIIDSE